MSGFMEIIKKGGSRQAFDAAKIAKGCKKSGANDEIANKVADAVAKKVKDGIQTEKIGELVIAELKKHDKKVAADFEGYFRSH